jgi:hypothetical protein
MAKPRIKSYASAVIATIKNATDEELAKFAFQIEGQTKANIQRNGQIDTGFMLNSVYTVTKAGGNTYDATRPTGGYVSRKSGTKTKRRLAPQRNIPDKAAAIVAVGAEYAVHQEIRKPFLYPAAQQTLAGRPGVELKNNIKRKVQETK